MTLFYQHYLVDGFNHLEKYESMGRIIPYIMENKKCSKPPTRIYTITLLVYMTIVMAVSIYDY